MGRVVVLLVASCYTNWSVASILVNLLRYLSLNTDLETFFSSFSDWFERRGIVSAYDAADPTNSTSAVRKNCTEKSWKTAETRKMRFTLGLVDKYNYKLLQFSRKRFWYGSHYREEQAFTFKFPSSASFGSLKGIIYLERLLQEFSILVCRDGTSGNKWRLIGTFLLLFMWRYSAKKGKRSHMVTLYCE